VRADGPTSEPDEPLLFWAWLQDDRDFRRAAELFERAAENIAAVMELYPVGERFFQEFTLRQVLLNAAKNGSGLSAAGTSSPAEGPNTAEPAATTVSHASKASRGRTDGSALTASTP
jgi:hypothetical protein